MSSGYLICLVATYVYSVIASDDDAPSIPCTDDGGESSAFEVPAPFNYILIMLLVCLSALFSGLTLGLLGLDVIGLEIIIGGDNDILKRCAKEILPIRKKGNLLLCTLLLGNVATNALLSILMADMTSGLVGFLSSTVMIVIFGEIIPQATCSRYALQIGRRSLPVVKFFIVALFVVAYPLSVILDYALGEEVGTVHTRTELLTMLKIHERHQQLDQDTVNVMSGAINYRDKKVEDVMTPADKVFMISVNEKLNYKVLSEVFKSGYSRIPVYGRDRNDIVGVLLAKDLIFIDPEDETPVRNFITLFGRPYQVVWHDSNLGEVLKAFKQGKGHLAFARAVKENIDKDNTYEIVGVITLEDIIEEILGEEIEDETDDVDAAGPARDRELARLIMLTGKVAQEKLEVEETQAVASHLLTNVPQLKSIFESNTGRPAPSIEDVQTMVTKCKVMQLKRQSTNDMIAMSAPANEDILFKRGKMSKACALILSGKITVLAGKDEFHSELGPWSIVGADAVKLPEGTYLPDFTAFVSSETVRCLWITKSEITQLLSGKPDGNDQGRYRRRAQQQRAKSSVESKTMGQTPVSLGSSDPDTTLSPLHGILKGGLSSPYQALGDDTADTFAEENGVEMKNKLRGDSW
eukprot:CAMPEP_0185032998 /NCGR_PEP_ID=MMETSP1103-20130426/21585_1 /TAXON_ID=36769 /ORGANISM="Paraphysomonas bandaiensis, Strain Caron Lab Isolate" /LENGTH=635 /DNA_ID=CAMNT_0027569117 /DNA_START=55 /DNA_END=1959 /DNA_ORIENTATION=-